MPVPWIRELGVYPARMEDGQPCVMTVDLGAVEHGAVATHPTFLGIRVPLQRPLETGLAGNDERPALDSLHERLEAEVVAAADGLFVARYIAEGCLNLNFTC